MTVGAGVKDGVDGAIVKLISLMACVTVKTIKLSECFGSTMSTSFLLFQCLIMCDEIGSLISLWRLGLSAVSAPDFSPKMSWTYLSYFRHAYLVQYYFTRLSSGFK